MSDTIFLAGAIGQKKAIAQFGLGSQERPGLVSSTRLSPEWKISVVRVSPETQDEL
jgi:hypothetical protein